MSLFGGEDVFTADALSTKLFDEEADPIKKATLAAILMNGNIHNYHMFTHLNGYSLFVDRYLRYGRDHYINGLPEGKLYVTSLDPVLVDPPIELEQGVPVTVLGAQFSEVKLEYAVYTFLQETYNWTIDSNILMINSVLYRYVSYETNYVPPTPGFPSYPATLIYITLANIADGTELIINISMPPEGVYAHATYHYDSEDATVKRFWMYKPDGTYPDIDAAINDTTPYGEQFLPIVPIRIDGNMLNEIDDPDLYPSCKSTLKKLQLSIDDLQDALSGENLDEEEEKPNLEDLDDTWFLFGADIYNELPEVAEYLFRFLHGLHLQLGLTKDAFEASRSNVNKGEEVLTQAYNVTEGQFDMFLEFNYIDVLPPVPGVLEKEYVKHIEYILSSTYLYTEYDGDGNPYPSAIFYIENSYISIKKRERDANHQLTGNIIELILHGPVHVSNVKALGHRERIFKYIDEDFIGSGAKAGESGFYLPISHVTLDEVYNRVDKEIILYESMMLALYAGHVEELAWWQTGLFRVLLVIVMAVISVVLILTFNPAATISVAIMQTMFNIAIAMVLSFTIGLLAEHLGSIGVIIAAIAAVALAVYTGYISFDFTSVTTLLDSVAAIPSTAWSTANTFVDSYFKAELSMLKEEYDDFLLDAKEQQAKLDDEWDMLSPEGDSIDILYITRNTLTMDPNEGPSAFIARTLDMNPGIETLRMIETFVDNALALPEPDYIAQPWLAA